MKTIYKYRLDGSILKLPVGYRLLDIQNQNGELTLWALIDPNQTSQVLVDYRVIGTGWKNDLDCFSYFRTVQVDELVWHVFFATVDFKV